MVWFDVCTIFMRLYVPFTNIKLIFTIYKIGSIFYIGTLWNIVLACVDKNKKKWRTHNGNKIGVSVKPTKVIYPNFVFIFVFGLHEKCYSISNEKTPKLSELFNLSSNDVIKKQKKISRHGAILGNIFFRLHQFNRSKLNGIVSYKFFDRF